LIQNLLKFRTDVYYLSSKTGMLVQGQIEKVNSFTDFKTLILLNFQWKNSPQSTGKNQHGRRGKLMLLLGASDNSNEPSQIEKNRAIFRAEALSDYRVTQEKPTALKLAPPLSFPVLWLGLALLFFLAGLLLWTGRGPVYTTGPGWLLPDTNRPARLADKSSLIVFLPKSASQNLRVGQPVELQSQLQPGRWYATLEKIEPEIPGIEEITRRYGLNLPITNPEVRASVVALVSLRCDEAAKAAPSPNCLDVTASYAQGIWTAKVEIGSRRLVSLLPLANQLIGD
jgi:hypothetical protein